MWIPPSWREVWRGPAAIEEEDDALGMVGRNAPQPLFIADPELGAPNPPKLDEAGRPIVTEPIVRRARGLEVYQHPFALLLKHPGLWGPWDLFRLHRVQELTAVEARRFNAYTLRALEHLFGSYARLLESRKKKEAPPTEEGAKPRRFHTAASLGVV